MTQLPDLSAPNLTEARATDTRRILALPTPRRAERRIFVIRGDLTTSTGYGQATRNLAHLLRDAFELYGVDLYPERGGEPHLFPGRLVDDHAVAALCAQNGRPPVILNYTTPDGFRYFHSGVNIGSFYWETSPLPIAKSWRELIDSMDYMWAPSSYVKGLIETVGYKKPVSIVTWPFDFHAEVLRQPRALRGVSAGLIENLSKIGEDRIDLHDLRNAADFLFLSVKSLAPRKGLPILLTEWRDYVADRPSRDFLLLKLRFVHNARLHASPEAHIDELVRRAGFRTGERVNIAYIAQDLSHPQLAELFHLSDAYVTASYGEGFGGPVVESLLLKKPVVSARHTGAADLLPEGYPLVFPSEQRHVGLIGNMSVYSHAATWELPIRGGISSALHRARDMSPVQKQDLVADARAHAAQFCSREAVSAQLTAFFDAAGL